MSRKSIVIQVTEKVSDEIWLMVIEGYSQDAIRKRLAKRGIQFAPGYRITSRGGTGGPGDEDEESFLIAVK